EACNGRAGGPAARRSAEGCRLGEPMLHSEWWLFPNQAYPRATRRVVGGSRGTLRQDAEAPPRSPVPPRPGRENPIRSRSPAARLPRVHEQGRVRPAEPAERRLVVPPSAGGTVPPLHAGGGPPAVAGAAVLGVQRLTGPRLRVPSWSMGRWP